MASAMLLGVVALLWATGGRWAGTWRLPGTTPAEARFVAASGGGVYVVTQTVSLPADGTWIVDQLGPGDVLVRHVGDDSNGRISAGILNPVAHFGWLRVEEIAYPRIALSIGPGPPIICSITTTAVIIPFWAMALAFVVLPPLWLWRHRRQQRLNLRIARGLCRACGYDLRASPGRCPECGLVPRAVQAA